MRSSHLRYFIRSLVQDETKECSASGFNTLYCLTRLITSRAVCFDYEEHAVNEGSDAEQISGDLERWAFDNAVIEFRTKQVDAIAPVLPTPLPWAPVLSGD